MRMIHNYEEFCQLYDQGKVEPDVSSKLGWRSVKYLIKQGWQIESRNFFGIVKFSKVSDNLLAKCRQSEENFELAYKNAGIDFWVYDN